MAVYIPLLVPSERGVIQGLQTTHAYPSPPLTNTLSVEKHWSVNGCLQIIYTFLKFILQDTLCTTNKSV
jgi:hypothetical protein